MLFIILQRLIGEMMKSLLLMRLMPNLTHLHISHLMMKIILQIIIKNQTEYAISDC